ncbi:MAG: NADP-dependent malic enzyme [Rhodospirillum sp.]|nr:NADP-dependent malic enzyme [Rhodospirillum sp.]MCF8490599.1 NADP-dependent malic enzyme [Rhodospirillum sp.]MCF8498954.1 NADP-dependent malic enzyme [Rhodospirillum sp.]
MPQSFDDRALAYHAEPRPGKLQIMPTKPLATQRDLSLAYSPGVAAASRAIAADPNEAARLTIRGNLVAVVTNGSAVLGLGNIGPLAAKPVMEGKAVLFKKFADIDVFDIEIKSDDPDHMVEVIAALEPTFGGINLEDIKAPECFIVEKKLRERMNIPVFHDDQHGTAIVVSAAVLNGLRLVGKAMEEIQIVSTGGGAAGIACLNLLCAMGVRKENIVLVDHLGVIHQGRNEEMTAEKKDYATARPCRTLKEAMVGADVFLGLSAPNIVNEEMVGSMADQPMILALANPTPEADPEMVRRRRPDAIMATGRSDYPNQVNNVLCFPFLFRGALDVGASAITEEMKMACVRAIADLAHREGSDVVSAAYGGQQNIFGPDYLIPKPFDPRLIAEVAPAVAQAAMDCGVASRPIADMEAYREKLNQFVFRSGLIMKPIVEAAQRNTPPKRVVFAEGEQESVLYAIKAIMDERLAQPILVGRPGVIDMRLKKLGLPLRAGDDFEVVNPEDDARYQEFWSAYHHKMERRGVSTDAARTVVRTNTTAIAAMMVDLGYADAMLCGTYGHYQWHLRHVKDIIGLAPGVSDASALSLLITAKGSLFMADTYVSQDPNAEDIVEMSMLAVEQIRRFGIEPKVALLSHANFGNSEAPSAQKMRKALALLRAEYPELEAEGEMHADAALSEEIRLRIFPNSLLKGSANLLVMPNLDAANIAFTMTKVMADGLAVGPILLGCAKPVHILSPSATARGIFNMCAIAAVQAGDRR